MSRRVAVVGAGLAGVTTAYELAALGAQVQVFERGGSVAEQASFACSALLSPTVPALPAELPPAPLLFRVRRWRARGQAGEASAQLAALSQLSLARTAALRQELGLEDEATQGLLLALPDAKRAAAVEGHLEAWKALGLSIDLIDATEARRREPGLNPEAPLQAALAVASGGTGNARLFAQQLRQQARRLGVTFRFHSTVRAVSSDGTGLTLRHDHTPPAEAPTRGAEREPGDTVPQLPGVQDERFDAVVLCNGLGAAALAGQRLPLAALQEITVTAPLRLLEAHPDLGPKAAWADPARGLTVTRIGQRVRVTGGLAVTRPQHRQAPTTAEFETLHRGLQHWFPGSVLHQQVQQGSSRRAVVPDGLPLLGAGGRPGLWLNLSPGGSGWGQACGAAQALARQIMGESALLELSALSPQRLA